MIIPPTKNVCRETIPVLGQAHLVCRRSVMRKLGRAMHYLWPWESGISTLADPEIFQGGWLLVLDKAKAYGGWLASNGMPSLVVLHKGSCGGGCRASHPFHLPWISRWSSTCISVHEPCKRQIEPLSLGTNVALRTVGGGGGISLMMHAPLVFLYFVCYR